MKLKEFQLQAVNSLFQAMQTPTRDIVLKSPTGSGKTIILTYFMHQYIQSFPKTVFVWLTPGKGNLEEQSKAKMDKYIHSSKTKLLSDVMTGGFEADDNVFINWEKLTKKGNTALKESERTNFLEHIDHALKKGLRFVIIVDESHQNNTIKADEILQYFHTEKIIRCSATPKEITKAEIIEIPEEEVIVAGLIKKMLIINENFPAMVRTEDQTVFLLSRALEKQRAIRSEFLQKAVDINPLIVVQLPNKSEVLQESVERFFEKEGISYENRRLACWLSERHENLENIDENNALSEAIIIKQAVATGWDCPRAHILVKLRDNMDETFEIQTVGRIRRMPQAKHYESDQLDSCYLYTFDEKFTAGVKMTLGKGALDASTLFLSKEYRDFQLVSEQRSALATTYNAKQTLDAVYQYAKAKYGIGLNKLENKTRLEIAGYVFSEEIIRHTFTGELTTISEGVDNLERVGVVETLSTKNHGREYHRCVAKIGLEMGFEYSFMNTIFRKLFDENFTYQHKILALSPRLVYAFVLNNKSLLHHLIREAMAASTAQCEIATSVITTTTFKLPQKCLFTFDSSAKTQQLMFKNVYNGYLSSAEPRTMPERRFEKFCEANKYVYWFYKNGDKGNEYLSIAYEDNAGKQKLFYPDYIVCILGEIWIIETKGGFDKTGNSQDIDLFTAKKFEVLKRYLEKYGLKGGIVRHDAKSDELCICTESYSEDIGSDNWVLLSEVIGKKKHSID